VIAFHRCLEVVGQDVAVAASLNESTYYGYRLGFPGSGWWAEVFNSNVYDNWVNPIVAGNGSGECGGVASSRSARLGAAVLPANGMVIFARP
jgi:1,4-alpha-glucan branching enzyme